MRRKRKILVPVYIGVDDSWLEHVRKVLGEDTYLSMKLRAVPPPQEMLDFCRTTGYCIG